VTDALLLDTHIALWLDAGDDRLRSSTRALIDGCWQQGGTICLSAVTIWEIALLVDTGRIDLDLSIEGWMARFLERPGIKPVPLGHCAASPQLPASSSRAPRPGRSSPDRNGHRARLPAGHQ
jgi:PIN domain nuclease of toxin-antitoxin system